MIGLVIVVIIIILGLIILKYNRIKSLNNKVKQSKSSIDVYLNQRFELIPNLVECVKAYAKHEEDLFQTVAELRATYSKNKKIQDGAKLNNKCSDILLLSEKYPGLKASENFLDLQRKIEKMESQLQAARRLYNSDVTMYNNNITTFPGNIFARLFGFKEEDLFEIEELKRVNIDVNL